MGKGDSYTCKDCDHIWKSRGKGTKICPNCNSDDIMKSNSVILAETEKERQIAEKEGQIARQFEAMSEKERFEVNKIIYTDKIEENRLQRQDRERIKKVLGDKEFSQRLSDIEHSNIRDVDKERLKNHLGVNRKKFENILLGYEAGEQKRLTNTKRNKIFVYGNLISILIIFLLLPFLFGVFHVEKDIESPVVFPNYSILDCQYRETVETAEDDLTNCLATSSVDTGENSTNCLSTKDVETGEENKLLTVGSDEFRNPLEFSNFGGSRSGGQCHSNLNVKNKVDATFTFTITYILTGGGGTSIPQSKTHTINPFESLIVSDDFAPNYYYASCGVSESSIDYTIEQEGIIGFRIERVTNEVCAEYETIKEDVCTGYAKVKIDRCKVCDLRDCLNDFMVCKEDFQCGSGICNILGFCGDERVIECPEGKINVEDKCVDNTITKLRKNYFNFGYFFFLFIFVLLLYFIYYEKIFEKF